MPLALLATHLLLISLAHGQHDQQEQPVDAETLNACIELLQDDDRSVRQAAAEKMLEIGEPALEAIEQAIRERRASTLGQTKLVLLELRNRRLDREWTERLNTLKDRLDGAVYEAQNANGTPKQRITFRVRDVPDDPTLVDFEVELFTFRKGKHVEHVEHVEHFEARCRRDHTLTPVIVTRTPAHGPILRATFEDRKATIESGNTTSPLVIDMPAPIGFGLLAMPMLSCMPMRADNMLIFEQVNAFALDEVPDRRTTMTCTGRLNADALHIVDVDFSARKENRTGRTARAHVDANGRVIELIELDQDGQPIGRAFLVTKTPQDSTTRPGPSASPPQP